MLLGVVGVSHHTAPVDVRERMAFSPSEASRALLSLREGGAVEEAVLLSTCNRTEIYLFPIRDSAPLHEAERILLGRAGTLDRPARDYLFEERGERVVRHLFEVSSGLDSLVPGEAEIQGQVRDAYELASSHPFDPPMAGPVLHRLFQTALAVGGRVRSETAIAEGTASVASVAVELARKIFGSLRDKRVMILGAGATAELMVEALAREGVEGVLVLNRTRERAEPLADRVSGRALPMERLHELLPSADIVLSSTSAPHAILTGEAYRRAVEGGRRHPLLLIDIGVPRDVEPAVGDEPEVFLYNVDDLRKIVDEHVKLRAEAIPEADRIIRTHAEEFCTWYASLRVVPVIRHMREGAERHRVRELDRLLRGMEHLSAEDRARLEEFSRRLMRKVLHEPTLRLRKGMAREEGAELLDALRFLYGSEGRERPPGPEPGGMRQHDGPSAPEGEPPERPADPHHGAGE